MVLLERHRGESAPPTKDSCSREFFAVYLLIGAFAGFSAGLLGLGGGALSSMLGIGGGTLTVPFLSWFNVPLREAVATASACGLIPAVVGTTLFVAIGFGQGDLPALATGYLYWPAFIGIAATSLLIAPLGARCTHRLPVTTLRRIFAVLLAAIGAEMVITG